MKRLCLVLAIALLWSAGLAAQNKVSAQRPAETVPNDFSGMYSFLQEGEFVQITVEQGKVTGFVSRYGDLDSDRGAFLDQFFKSGSTDGHNVAFTTQSVHGTWFEFQGTVGRGPGKTLNEDGYYIMQGKLTRYNTDAAKKATAQSREVTFKSFPQDAVVDVQKHD